MKYRTACPHCASVFRLGPDQLDAAQGWAQCGVCGRPFDARPALKLEDGSPLPPEVAAALAPAAAPPPAVASGASSAVAAEDAASASPPHGDETAGVETPVGIAQREASIELDLPSIILIEPDLPVDEDFGPLPQIYPPPAAPKPGPASAPPPTPSGRKRPSSAPPTSHRSPARRASRPRRGKAGPGGGPSPASCCWRCCWPRPPISCATRSPAAFRKAVPR